jgi:enamine deaminase RidA (YjgF/YER057c/UK114 family)
MGKVESRINELKIAFPRAPKSVAAYIRTEQTGQLVFAARQPAMVNGELISKGLLGQDFEIDEANKAARICNLNALTASKGIIGDFDRIKQRVKIVGYAASLPTFTQQHAIVNGASELLLGILSENRIHARSAVGMAVLAMNASVGIELSLEVE